MMYLKKGGTMDNPFEILMTEIQSLKKIISNLSISSTCPDNVYLKIDEAAQFLRMSKGALNQMIYKKQIQSIKKQGKHYFLKSELIAWIESGRAAINKSHPEDYLVSNKKLKSNKAA